MFPAVKLPGNSVACYFGGIGTGIGSRPLYAPPAQDQLDLFIDRYTPAAGADGGRAGASANPR